MDKQLKKVANGIILDTIKNKRECRVYLNSSNKSVQLDCYEDKIGINSVLALYMSNSDGLQYPSTICSILDAKTNQSRGCFTINWDKVKSVKVQCDYDRYLLVIDDLHISI